MSKRTQAVIRKTLRPHDPQPESEMEDLGIPGKMYFDKPQLTIVEAFHKPAVPEGDTARPNNNVKVGPDHFYRKDGPCRLRSSHLITRYNPPDAIHYLLTMRPPQEEADSYLKMMAVDGYGEGAIVSRRYQPGWKHKWHGNWGMITRVVGFVPHSPNDPWNPYFVKWFGEAGSSGPQEEFGWAEDLVIIHAALDKTTLESILEEQDVDTGAT